MADPPRPTGRTVRYGALFRSARRRARVAAWVLGATLLAHVAVVILDVRAALLVTEALDDPSVAVERESRRDRLAEASFAVYGVSVLLSGLALAVWLRRAYANVEAVSPRYKRFDTYWGWAGWVVPIFAFFRPYQVISDVWRASDDGRRPPPWVLGWWLLFIATEVGRRFAEAAPKDTLESLRAYDLADAGLAAVSIGGIALAIRVVRRATALQDAHAARQPPADLFVPDYEHRTAPDDLREQGFTIEPAWAPSDEPR